VTTRQPDKRENRHRYPADWKAIRERILARAGYRCELCGVPNRRIVYRWKEQPAIWTVFEIRDPALQYSRPVRIVLTIAHLDPTYQCHDDKCLLALCQRCHLKIGAHVRHAARKCRQFPGGREGEG